MPYYKPMTHDISITWVYSYLQEDMQGTILWTLVSFTSSSKDILPILDAHTIRWFAILRQMHVTLWNTPAYCRGTKAKAQL